MRSRACDVEHGGSVARIAMGLPGTKSKRGGFNVRLASGGIASAISGPRIGARMAFLRRQRGISLEELAQKSGLTKSFLSKLERDLSVPSISTAMALAQAFGLTVSQLMGEREYDDAICVVRKGDRRSLMRRGSEIGYEYEMLAAAKSYKLMEPYIMRPPLKFQDEQRFEHAGQKFLFVLSGTLEVEFAGRPIRLNAGDAVYFDSNVPHRSRSLKGKVAEALVIVTGEVPMLPRQMRLTYFGKCQIVASCDQRRQQWKPSLATSPPTTNKPITG